MIVVGSQVLSFNNWIGCAAPAGIVTAVSGVHATVTWFGENGESGGSAVLDFAYLLYVTDYAPVAVYPPDSLVSNPGGSWFPVRVWTPYGLQPSTGVVDSTYEWRQGDDSAPAFNMCHLGLPNGRTLWVPESALAPA